MEAGTSARWKRVLHRRSQPQRQGEEGDRIYYWGPGPDNDRVLRWRGPCQVIMVKMPGSIWASYRGGVVKVSPPNVCLDSGGAGFYRLAGGHRSGLAPHSSGPPRQDEAARPHVSGTASMRCLARTRRHATRPRRQSRTTSPTRRAGRESGAGATERAGGQRPDGHDTKSSRRRRGPGGTSPTSGARAPGRPRGRNSRTAPRSGLGTF